MNNSPLHSHKCTSAHIKRMLHIHQRFQSFAGLIPFMNNDSSLKTGADVEQEEEQAVHLSQAVLFHMSQSLWERH